MDLSQLKFEVRDIAPFVIFAPTNKEKYKELGIACLHYDISQQWRSGTFNFQNPYDTFTWHDCNGDEVETEVKTIHRPTLDEILSMLPQVPKLFRIANIQGLLHIII